MVNTWVSRACVCVQRSMCNAVPAVTRKGRHAVQNLMQRCTPFSALKQGVAELLRNNPATLHPLKNAQYLQFPVHFTGQCSSVELVSTRLSSSIEDKFIDPTKIFQQIISDSGTLITKVNRSPCSVLQIERKQSQKMALSSYSNTVTICGNLV